MTGPTRVSLPSFAQPEFSSREMRQLVQALELRFQAIEGEVFQATLPSTETDGTGVYQPVTMTASITLDNTHQERNIFKEVSTAGLSIILTSGNEFSVASSLRFLNAGNSSVTIDAATNAMTLWWLTGSAITGGVSQSKTVGYGEVMRLYRYSDTTYYGWNETP